MSFKGREAKRKKKVAQEFAQRAARESKTTGTRYYLTKATRPCSCASCGCPIRPGRDLVYRRTPLDCRCLECAHQAGTKYRTSLAWDRARNKGRGR